MSLFIDSYTRPFLSGFEDKPHQIAVIKYGVSGVESTDYYSPWIVKLGRIPVVSTLSGGGRVLAGTVHSVAHLAAYFFSEEEERQLHWSQVKIGVKNIIRGYLEVFPISGNLVVKFRDYTSFHWREKSKQYVPETYISTTNSRKKIEIASEELSSLKSYEDFVNWLK